MRRGFGWLTALTLALLVAFGMVDAVAHFTGYAHGETFSALIWHLSATVPGFRWVVAAACVVLFAHLVFRRP